MKRITLIDSEKNKVIAYEKLGANKERERISKIIDEEIEHIKYILNLPEGDSEFTKGFDHSSRIEIERLEHMKRQIKEVDE